MRATKVHYERVVNLGDYNNVKIGVELELDAGETAQQAYAGAKQFVEQKIWEEKTNGGRNQT